MWAGDNEAERGAAIERGEEPPECESMPFGLSNYGKKFEMSKALKTLSEEDLYSRVTCALCSDLPHQPMMTDVSFNFSLSFIFNLSVPLNDWYWVKVANNGIVQSHLLQRMPDILHASLRRPR